MAEGAGFEPAIRLPVYTLSRRAPSTNPEWLKAHAWRACIRATVSRVRIPLPPPSKLLNLQCFWFRRARFEIPGHLRRFAAMPIGAPSGETVFIGCALRNRPIVSIGQ